MSLIIGMKEGNKIVLGCDTQLTQKDIKRDYSYEETTKCHILKKYGLVILSAGSVKTGDFFKFSEDIFKDFPKEGLTKNYIVRNIIPAFREIAKEHNLLDDDGDMNLTVILACKDKIFVIDDNFMVYRVNTYYASGVGWAIPDFYYREKNMSAKDKILASLRYVSKNYYGVSGPFIIMDTESLETEIVEA